MINRNSPKPRELSTKIETTLLLATPEQHNVFIRKAPTQPITNNEQNALHHIYIEAVNRLARTIEHIKQLEHYLTNQLDNKHIANGKPINFKHLLAHDLRANHDLRHTLNMIKRHFYINIQHITRPHLISNLGTIRSIITDTYEGLSAQTGPVYINHISRKRQNNPQNTTSGYVYSRNGKKFGDIYIDFRALTKDPIWALICLIHEASHRYGQVNDQGKEGYYHQRKMIKQNWYEFFSNTAYYRKASSNLNTEKATDNADSFAHFCVDLTDFWIHDKNQLPTWWNLDISRKQQGVIPYFAIIDMSVDELTESYIAQYEKLPGNNNVLILKDNTANKPSEFHVIFKKKNHQLELIKLSHEEIQALGDTPTFPTSRIITPITNNHSFNRALSHLLIAKDGLTAYQEELALETKPSDKNNNRVAYSLKKTRFSYIQLLGTASIFAVTVALIANIKPSTRSLKN